MKKTLLSVALIVGAYFSANAQQNISFETAEGYNTGALFGQNAWVVMDDEEGGPGETAVVVSNERYTEGAQSLKFVADEEDNFLYYDVLKSFDAEGTTFSISQDIYVDGIDTEWGSDLDLITGYIDSESATLTSLVYFSYDGTINIHTGYDEEGYPVVEEFFTFSENGWFNIKVSFDTTAGTVTYYVNNEQVHTTNLTPGFAVNTLGYTFGSYTTSYYADNLTITSGTTGVKQQLASKFSVSPNPATNSISIANTASALINNATLTDVNGRTVKTAKFAGVSTAQMNIADLASGVYMLNISSDRGTATKKIVKN
ncbi:T9SS type A sorting domain-containing protein [Flavobacterium sp. Sd200]|uniref:T9SS type A sorting domain-containing protein n=1 Tax=Flavobacterium sp. Sd200 TaxID=2692211 RepID=UPI00136B03A1|nr:T9SS type A sorting domain-containing protein [Flavobacterium sp. Sd200]MXN92308.1 T9SS type A sorting domain-containing protein [Flavobacterium sp. Sd200]